MDMTKLTTGKTIVSGSASSGKTAFLQTTINHLTNANKVIVGYINVNDWRNELNNITAVNLKEAINEEWEALIKNMPAFVEKFIATSLAKWAICIVDGFGVFRNNETIIDTIFNLEGNFIITLQDVWLYASKKILEGVRKADRIIELGKITAYNNIETYQNIGAKLNEIYFVNQ